ncbi:hypothetical protein Elgi_33410 [Paenibacillus elgii]|nr:hypothetical protein Elgi_33410 [Paenibacillus elgii]
MIGQVVDRLVKWSENPQLKRVNKIDQLLSPSVSDEQQNIKPTLETFQLFLSKIQQNHSSVEWNAEELIRLLPLSPFLRN